MGIEEGLWESLIRAGKDALRRQQPDEADENFKTALSVAETFGAKDVRLIETLNFLAFAHFNKGDYGNAEQFYKRALKTAEDLWGEHSPDLIITLTGMGTNALSLKKVDVAEGLFKRALTLSQKHHGASSPETARILRTMVVLYEKQAKFDEAEKIYNGLVSFYSKSPATKKELDWTKAALESMRQKKIKVELMQKSPPTTPKPATANRSTGDATYISDIRPGALDSAAGAAERVLNSMPVSQEQIDQLIGKTIDNRYEIISYLGHGGMSVVFKARHRFMEKLVAFKMLLSHLAGNKTTLQRFQREAKTACQINHPNVVSTHDFGMTEDGNLYLVMDFIEGGSLDDLIRDSGALPEERAVPIFIQICDAVQFAHDIGVLHRDLKPSNVMLTKQGTRSDWVKLVDFGLAKFVSDDTGNGAEVGSSTLSELGGFIGSPLYVSPEHIQGQKLDRRSDIYSWGCLAYMTVTGKNAMSGANVIDIVLKQLNQIPAPFAEAAPGVTVSDRLEGIIMKAMQKDPANRHASFNELKAELQANANL